MDAARAEKKDTIINVISGDFLYNEPKKSDSFGGLNKVETTFLKKNQRRHRVSPCANDTTRISRPKSP